MITSSNNIGIGVGSYYGKKALFIQPLLTSGTIGIGVPELQWNHKSIPEGTVVVTFNNNSDVQEMITTLQNLLK